MKLRRLIKASSKKITAILLAGVLYSNFYPALFSANPVIASASMTAGISVDKATAGVSETITYTATINNNGDQELTNVVLSNSFDANVTYKAGSTVASKSGGSSVNWEDSWVSTGINLGNLTGGQTVTLRFQAEIKSGVSNGTTLRDSISVTSDQITDARTADTVTTVSQTGQPAMSPSKSVDKATAKRGDTLTYTLSVRNTGNTDLNNVRFVEDFPRYLNYVSGSAQSFYNGVNPVSIIDAWLSTGTNFGILHAGDTATVSFRAIVANDAPNGLRIENVGKFRSDETPNEVQCAAYTTIEVPESHPAMAPSKSVDKTSAKRGEALTYTLTVKNTGDVPLHNVRFVEDLPRYVSYVSGSAQSFYNGVNPVAITDAWLLTGTNFGILNVGDTATVKLRVTIGNDAPNGFRLENVGKFRSDETPNEVQCAAYTTIVVDEIPTPTPTPRAGDPALSLTKKIRYDNKEVISVESSTHVFNPGEKVTYRLFVGNSGTGDSGKLTITDNLPNFLSWDSGDGSYDAGSNKINFDLGVLKGGESKTLTYVAKVSDKVAPGLHSQQNTAVLYEEKGEKGRSSTNIWVGTSSSVTTGEILSAQAPAKLPVSGGGMELLQISGLVSMLAGGVGIKLRKFNLPKRITVPTSEITGKWF